MIQVAIQEELDGKNVDWMEQISDEDDTRGIVQRIKRVFDVV